MKPDAEAKEAGKKAEEVPHKMKIETEDSF